MKGRVANSEFDYMIKDGLFTSLCAHYLLKFFSVISLSIKRLKIPFPIGLQNCFLFFIIMFELQGLLL